MGHSAWSSYFRLGIFYSLMAALWISFLENRSLEKLLAPGKRCVPIYDEDKQPSSLRWVTAGKR
jgi:hypothetical protein